MNTKLIECSSALEKLIKGYDIDFMDQISMLCCAVIIRMEYLEMSIDEVKEYLDVLYEISRETKEERNENQR